MWRLVRNSSFEHGKRKAKWAIVKDGGIVLKDHDGTPKLFNSRKLAAIYAGILNA